MDIFSRIFAIPSDVSSTEEDNNVAAVAVGAGNDGIRRNGGARMQKRGHSRTLTPLSLTDGNGTVTSQSYGEGTLSYGSASEEGEEPLSPTSTSSDIEDHSYDVMEDNARPPSNNNNNNNNNRGRQRSASEQPTSRFHDINKKKHHHHHHHKTHRSSSTATSSRKSSNVTTGMQLQLNSPSKKQQHNGRSRHSSKSRGAAASGKTNNNKDPTLTRVHSWSSGEEDDSNNERRQRRHSRSRPTLEQQQQKDGQRRSSGSNMSNQQRNGNHNAAASSSKNKKTPTTSAATAAVKKERNYWRTKLTGGMKKHLSPGMSSASTPSPQQQRRQRPSSSSLAKSTKPASSAVYYTSRSSKNKSTVRGDRPKQSSPDSKQRHNNNKNKNTNTTPSSKKNKLNLPPSAISRKQPINVGDNIIISQQFLEESADMSVLTMPRELIAVAAEEEEAKAKALDVMMEDEMMVLQDDENENDNEDYYYEDCNNGDEFQPHRTVHENNDRMDHAYYDGRYNRRDHYSQQQQQQQQHLLQQQQEEGILSSTTAEQIGAYASRVIQQEGRMNKHIHAIHGTQDSIMHDIHIGDGAAGMSEVRPMMHQQQHHLGIVASMQPPPPPPLLPSQSYGMPTSRPPQNSNIPHWNTPAASGSNSESIATTSYDDPPGMLVTSPALQLQPSASSFGNTTTTNLEKDENDKKPTTTTSPLLSATDPPGDPYRPFDEQTEFHPVPPQTTQGNSNNNKLRSNNNNKAVTFSLPPQTTTIATASSNGPPPAPPFMGPTFDYYYSMERSNTNNSQFNFSPSLRILPPIIELYSVVEGSDTMIPGGGNDDVVPVSSWDDTRRKCALMGGEEEEEDSLPLIVAESWINACDNNKNQEASDAAESYHHHLDTGPDDSEVEVSEKINAAASAAVAFAIAIDKESMPSAWNKGDAPHDEHFNDILDCGESLLNHPADEMAANDGNESQGVDSVIPRVNNRSSSSSSSSDSLGPDEEDANVRHRSTWNAAAYKPPKLSSLDYDPSIHEQQLNNDQWQNTVRTRTQAAIILQKSIRGLLELSKLDRLIDATLVIQPVIRRYLSRKRYVEYIKLKRSYYPNRWRRNNVAVAL